MCCRFESVEEDLIKGAPVVLKHLFRCLNDSDSNAIALVCEDKLTAKIQGELKISDAKKFPVPEIDSVRLLRLQLLMGALRGEDISEKSVLPFWGQMFVLRHGAEDMDSGGFRERIDLIRKELHAGMVVMAEMELGSSSDRKYHRIVLECSVTPNPEIATSFRPVSQPHTDPTPAVAFEGGEWRVADWNNVLNGNFPVDVPE